MTRVLSAVVVECLKVGASIWALLNRKVISLLAMRLIGIYAARKLANTGTVSKTELDSQRIDRADSGIYDSVI